MTGGRVIPGKAVPRGAFPHYRRAGDFIFVSGTSERRADNSIAGAVADAFGATTLDIAAQTRAVIDTIADILADADASLTDIVDLGVFLVNMNDFRGFNAVYAEYFGVDGPTRTSVAVHQLPHPHLLIEIRATAHAPQARGHDSGKAD